MNNFYAIVPAAGMSTRFGAAHPKQYALLNGLAVIRHSVRILLAEPRICLIVVAVAASDEKAAEILAEEVASGRVKVIACGGESRAKTVRNALTAVVGNGAEKTDWVLVHDAARPGLPFEALQRLMHLSQSDVIGGLLALPVADTLKRAGKEHHASVTATLAREDVWQAQTPQLFQIGQLTQAIEACLRNNCEPGDEAQAMEYEGHAPVLVQGARINFKITVQEDLQIMEKLLANPVTSLRIGQGFDVHALATGRKLIIGGVEIPHTKGLLGHSDADVLLHAITDALLGAAALGDIGKHFPDTDANYKDADSKILLAQAYTKVQAQGWKLMNLDSTIIAQAPKLATYIQKMTEIISKLLKVEESNISIKAKTAEKLGALGREEGISAHAIVILCRA
ncbi:MAG: 2-C-methyl-D-erythritol 2,4-cyclodiphosphate synthase [Burkholderiaceae bacterium]|nr:2-C-methyl-D-erythritol 2,4-cyclodiphosphate synthase [Burkholderiaceae bacterium]